VSAPAIETFGLTKFYGETRGIEDLELRVERGEVFGYLGPNGAGKTTTIRLLLDLIRPTRGRADAVPAEDVTLSWATFSDAADEAGISRRLGGIHFEQGDLEARASGRLVGAQAWEKAVSYWAGR
jgi:ABC-type Na+ transport system ATPase subunit NatA